MKINYIDDIYKFSEDSKVIFCDLWGVIHNGKEPFKGSLEFLEKMNAQNIPIIFISNAPRPNQIVRKGLTEKLGIKSHMYHSVITSGDISVLHINREIHGTKYYHLGPEKDHDLLKEIKIAQVSEIIECDFVLCTGLDDDDKEKPQDYEDILKTMILNNILMICVNPDQIVIRGDKEIPCAGAIASYYESLGGKVISYGKPHNEIYEYALTYALENKIIKSKSEILTIGDSFRTDIKGALDFGLKSIFIEAGIHNKEINSLEDIKDLAKKFIDSEFKEINIIKNL